MSSQKSLRNEMESRPEPDQYNTGTRKEKGEKRKAARAKAEGKSYPRKPKMALAPERSSMVAEVWMDKASRNDYRLPFNTNYLAHQIHNRVKEDPVFRKMLDAKRADDVERWLMKMVDLFWSEYLMPGDTNNTVSTAFLATCWDDLREYAYTCLRAAYLKEHGRQIPQKSEEDAVPHYDQPLYRDLQETQLRTYAEDALNQPELPIEHKRLDSHRKQVLRSAVERRTK